MTTVCLNGFFLSTGLTMSASLWGTSLSVKNADIENYNRSIYRPSRSLGARKMPSRVVGSVQKYKNGVLSSSLLLFCLSNRPRSLHKDRANFASDVFLRLFSNNQSHFGGNIGGIRGGFPSKSGKGERECHDRLQARKATLL